MVYDISRRMLYMLCCGLFRFRCIGKEHVPTSGAVLLCSNHRSLWSAVSRQQLHPRAIESDVPCNQYKE